MAELAGVEYGQLLTTLRHPTGDIAIQCDADKTVSIMTNGVTRAQFGSAVGTSGPGAFFPEGVKTKQAVNNVNDTTPTKAELTTSFGNPLTLGRGFIGTVDDADGNTNGYLVFTSDADFFFLKFTKAI